MDFMPVLKGIHVVSIITWMAGLFTLGTLLQMARADGVDTEARGALGQRFRAIYLKIVAPALGLTLVTGITQMVMYIQEIPGWMKMSRWIHWKIMIVVGLMAVDHILMRRGIKLRKKPEEAVKPFTVLAIIGIVLMLAAIFLATIQPTK